MSIPATVFWKCDVKVRCQGLNPFSQGRARRQIEMNRCSPAPNEERDARPHYSLPCVLCPWV